MYKLTKFNKIWEVEEGKYLLYNSLSDTTMILAEDIYQNIMANRWEEIDDQTLQYLLTGYIIIQEDLDEKDIYEFEMMNLKTRKDKIGIVIVPSRTCNLACTYCMQNNLFNKDEHVFITKEVIDKYYEWIQDKLNKWGTSKLNFIFYGGEPLTTSKETLLYLFDKFNSLSIKPSYEMITNGINLLKYEEIFPKVTTFQITLDGGKEAHDTRRIHKDGSGSYDEIMYNIKTYLSMSKDNSIIFRMNIDKNNRDHLLDDVKEITSQLPMDQVTVSLNPVDPYKDGITDEYIHGDIRETALAMCKCHEYLKDKFNTEPRIWRMNCGVYSLCQWAFDTEGSIYKCPALTGEPERAVTTAFQKYMNSSFYKIMNYTLEDDNCISCAYLGLCYGACPRQKEFTHGHSCKKQFFEEYIPRMIELKYGIKNKVRK